MSLIVEREDVWVAGIADKPGTMADKLATLAEAGADLDFVIARRSPEKRGTAALFVTPLQGDREIDAASEAGFSVTSRLHSVRVQGENEPGIAAKISARLAKAGLNLRGFSGAVIGKQFVVHVGLDSKEDADKAIKVLKKL
jgi:hypothetical protein